MKEKEYKEIMGALDTLNKYRNVFYSSGETKDNKISNIIDEFLPKLHNEIINDELARIVMEKLRKQKHEK